MPQTNTKRYRNSVIKAILAIALFVVVYLLILAFASLVFLGFGGVGVAIIAYAPQTITIVLGGALVFFGGFFFFYVIKFIFKRHRSDLSGLIEIAEQQEPRLFHFIREIALQTGTPFPKHVYLSANVNASVFYDSTFGSLFFPIKKNLVLGIALLESSTVEELKAIIAHEFGHFSQKSMRLGSYVYIVNQIIYNILYENDSFNDVAGTFKSATWVGNFLVEVAGILIHGVQLVLAKTYNIVNLSHLELSREMEFHADQIAAETAGKGPLASTLLRMPLSDHAWDLTIGYYNARLDKGIQTANLYPQFRFLVEFLGKNDKLEIQNGLPQVELEFFAKLNKSKMVINEQWLSHPSTLQRIAALEKLEVQDHAPNRDLAVSLLDQMREWHEKATKMVFATAKYEVDIVLIETSQFVADINVEYQEASYDPIYHGYYDEKHPLEIDLNGRGGESGDTSPSSLFDNASIEMVYQHNALQNDFDLLQAIYQGDIKLKTFDYDGKKYHVRECMKLGNVLKGQLEASNAAIRSQDQRIFDYAMHEATGQGKAAALKEAYASFFGFLTDFNSLIQDLNHFQSLTGFIMETTPYEVIHQKMIQLKEAEKGLRKGVESILNSPWYKSELSEDDIAALKKYLSKNWRYFMDTMYDDAALKVLGKALELLRNVLPKAFQKNKRALLGLQAEILRGGHQPAI